MCTTSDRHNLPLESHLSIAPLHVSQRHLGVDGVAAGHTEDLQVCVVPVSLSNLETVRDGTGPDMDRSGPGREDTVVSLGVSHLLVLLDLLLLGVGDDGFQFMETFLHQREAEPGGLLLLPDSLQLSPPHLLGDAGTLLPLLDPLGEDLIDPAADHRQS